MEEKLRQFLDEQEKTYEVITFVHKWSIKCNIYN